MRVLPIIEIRGTTASGKSALAYAIKAMLAVFGIKCSIAGCEDESADRMEETWRQRMLSLAGRGETLQIQTVQATSAGIGSSHIVAVPATPDSRVGKACHMRYPVSPLHGIAGTVVAVYPSGTQDIQDPGGVLCVHIGYGVNVLSAASVFKIA